MKKRTKMSMLVAACAAACATVGAAVVSCGAATERPLPPPPPPPPPSCPGCSPAPPQDCNRPPRPIPWDDDKEVTDGGTDGGPKDAGEIETMQIQPSRQLLIASGAVTTLGWPLAYMYVEGASIGSLADASADASTYGRENLAFVSSLKAFTGNFSIGPAATPTGGLDLAQWSTTYCKVTALNTLYVRTATLVDPCALLAAPPTSGTSLMLTGNDILPVPGGGSVTVGHWKITDAAGQGIGLVHVFGGAEYWGVTTRAPTEPAPGKVGSSGLHNFTQLPVVAGTLQAKWDAFRVPACDASKVPDGGTTGYLVYSVSTKAGVACP